MRPMGPADGPFRIFIGYDPEETIAFHVLTHSLVRQASQPLAIIPIARHHLVGIHDRPRGPLDSTDFSLTRFLVPYFCQYQGVALFMDCDLLCRTDIFQLLDEIQPFGRWREAPEEAVWVAQHDYVPKSDRKFLDRPQTTYRRKNWSSVMLFNNARCTALTPTYVNQAAGLALHQFEWASRIGAFALDWNWLVGEYPPNPNARLLHYTLGGPWFAKTRECDQADEWWMEHARMRAIVDDPVPMGPGVRATRMGLG